MPVAVSSVLCRYITIAANLGASSQFYNLDVSHLALVLILRPCVLSYPRPVLACEPTRPQPSLTVAAWCMGLVRLWLGAYA